MIRMNLQGKPSLDCELFLNSYRRLLCLTLGRRGGVRHQGMSSMSHVFRRCDILARFHQPPPNAWNSAAVSA